MRTCMGMNENTYINFDQELENHTRSVNMYSGFEHMFAYVEMCYLFLFVAIGVPINLFTLARVGRQYYVTKSRILLLNVNLNISDLMILIFYAFAQALWISTEQWLGGWILCKFMRYFQLFSFCLSSNVIVCIGVDRLWSLLEPLHVKSVANLRCKRMLFVAWILAAFTSAPQLYLWNVVIIADQGDQFYQCVNTFGYLSNSSEWLDFETKADLWATLYDIYHLSITFWIPCVVVIVCYVIILKRVLKHLGDDPQIEIVQTKTCDCSSGASIGVPYMDPRTIRHQRHQYKRHHPPPQSDRRSSGSQTWKKGHSNDACCGHKKLSLQQSILKRNAGQMRIRRTKYRTLKVTMFIVAAYIICWFPYNFFNIWILIHPNVDDFWQALNGLIALNAIVNPLIYGRLTLALYWKGGLLSRRKNENQAKRYDGRAVRFI